MINNDLPLKHKLIHPLIKLGLITIVLDKRIAIYIINF